MKSLPSLRVGNLACLAADQQTPHCVLLTQRLCKMKDKSTEGYPACLAWGGEKESRAALIYSFGNGTLRNVMLSEAQSELRAEELACTTNKRDRQAITSNNQTTDPGTLLWIQAQGRFGDNCVMCPRGKEKNNKNTHNKLFSSQV